jgi:hypothetical protein
MSDETIRAGLKPNIVPRYPEEGDGSYLYQPLEENLKDLRETVIGHRIVSAEQQDQSLFLTLDTGQVVQMIDTSECCAYTAVGTFVHAPQMVDHVITGVGTENDFQLWHIYAGLDDMVKIDVNWSEGTGYYGYGFEIKVVPVESEHPIYVVDENKQWKELGS